MPSEHLSDPPDPTTERAKALRELFPEAFAEGKVDFSALREALGDQLDDAPERYSFTWAGKTDAKRILQTPTRATLHPVHEESLDWETTNHVFIEGDNLEVLKVLYKSYFGRVKMIYIDPPYNTGNDFIYRDNYTDPLDSYLRLTGQKDGNGNVLTTNAETNGRYHSAWLSMMYPRLWLARQLLREDGVIFVSIDDHEVHNLRMLMNEVFGEDTFIAMFIWKSRHNVDSRDQTGVSKDTEYVVCYGRALQGRQKDLTKYHNPDNDPRGPWMSDNLVGLATRDRRPNLHYDLIDPATGLNYGCPEKGWRYEPTVIARKIAEGRILWPASPGGRPRHKKFEAELESEFTGVSTLLDVPNTLKGTQEVRVLFGADLVDFPKPADLVATLVEQGARDGDTVMDFFAGSATTAHAVLQRNRADGGSRRFIMVQIPEPTGRDDYRTIADIGKERIRRVVAKLKEDDNGKLDIADREEPEDLGFRVFKLVEPTIQDPKTGATPDDQRALFLDPLAPGWNAEEVIFEVAIREGYGLNIRIEELPPVAGAKLWRVTDPDKEQTFRITLDDTLSPDILDALTLAPDDLLICRDVALDDTLSANLSLRCRLTTI